MPVNDTVIRIRELRKRYRDVVALDGIDLDIHRGEVFAVLGPNGAGKTTAVEICEGYRSRDSGQVRVLGNDPGVAGRAWRSRIGVVLQNTDDLTELTPRELVRHFACFYPRARDPETLLELVGLAGKATSRVRKLSGGQRRRLDVALGIVGDPELLFLDEPTTGFDPQARRQFWGLLRRLAGEGTTIVLTTHYLHEAEALADRVGVIAAGKLLAVAPPSSLGGREGGSATVGWTESGRARTCRTDTPTEVVRELAERFGGEIPDLTVGRPTLEETYLAMIGADGDGARADEYEGPADVRI